MILILLLILVLAGFIVGAISLLLLMLFSVSFFKFVVRSVMHSVRSESVIRYERLASWLGGF